MTLLPETCKLRHVSWGPPGASGCPWPFCPAVEETHSHHASLIRPVCIAWHSVACARFWFQQRERLVELGLQLAEVASHCCLPHTFSVLGVGKRKPHLVGDPGQETKPRMCQTISGLARGQFQREQWHQKPESTLSATVALGQGLAHG